MQYQVINYQTNIKDLEVQTIIKPDLLNNMLEYFYKIKLLYFILDYMLIQIIDCMSVTYS